MSDELTKLLHDGDRIIARRTLELPVQLSAVERLAKGDELAAVTQAAVEQKARAKSEKARLKADEEDLAQRLSDLAGIVARGEEMRPVEVLDVSDGNGSVLSVRSDTQEVIARRILSDAESQGTLFPPGMAPPSDDAPDA